MEGLVLPPYWRKSVHTAALIKLMRVLNPYPCILANSNLFEPNAEVSMGCPNDGDMYKSVEKSHPWSNEEMSLHSIGELKGSPSFTDFVDYESKYLAWYPLVEVGNLMGAGSHLCFGLYHQEATS